MAENYLHYLKLSIQARHRQIILLCLAFAVVSILVIRMIDTNYDARIRVFVSDEASVSVGGKLNLLGSLQESFSLMEKEHFIHAQKPLLYSLSVFKKVSSRLKQNGQADNEKQKLDSKMVMYAQNFLFGDTYLKTRSHWVNRDMAEFKDKVIFHENTESSYFDIGFKDPNPERAVTTARYIADSLIELNSEIYLEQKSKISAFLKEKISEIQKNLSKNNEKISSFIKNNDFPNSQEFIDLKYTKYLQSIEKLESAIENKSRSKIIFEEAKKFAEKLRKKSRGDGDSNITEVTEEILQLKQNQALEQNQLENQKQIRRLRETISDQVKGEIPRLGQTLEGLIVTAETNLANQNAILMASDEIVSQAKRIHEKIKSEIKLIPELQSVLSELLVENKQQSEILKVLTEQYMTALIESDLSVSRLYLVDDAGLDTLWTSSKLKTLLVALALSLALAILLIPTIDYFNATIYSKSDLKIASAKLIGVIPHLKKLNKSQFPSIIGIEPIRKIVHLLVQTLNQTEHHGHLVSMCSQKPLSGKSFSTLAIGNALSERNLEVLIIDAEYRVQDRTVSTAYKDYYHTVGQVESLDLLLQNIESKKIIRPKNTQRPNLVRLFPENTTEADACLYIESILPNAIDILRKNFNFVIIDLPPLFFADTLQIVSFTDASIFCLKEGSLSQDQYIEGIDLIAQIKPKNAQIFSIMTNAKLEENISSNISSASYNYRYHRRAS